MFSYFCPSQTILDGYNHVFGYELMNIIVQAMDLSNLIFIINKSKSLK